MIEIKSQQSLFEAVKSKTEIRWQTHSNGAIVAAYMIATDDTFDSLYARECRGIVFLNEKVVGRPVHKFFNMNEKPETQFANIDWTRVMRIMDKRDGSMINTVAIPSLEHNTPFSVKSKKTFDSRFAAAAMGWIKNKQAYVSFCERCVQNDLTATFEWTAPDNRVVINYKEPELQLLHIRENISGRYFPLEELQRFAGSDVKIVENFPLEAIQNILKSIDTIEGIEGWVIQFDDGEMLKIKTKWYLDRHHAMTALRERDVAELVLNETIDDVKSKLVGAGVDIKPLLEIEERVLYLINTINDGVESIYRTVSSLSRKDIALRYKDHSWFGLLMQRVSNKEPDIKKFVMKYLLTTEFSLKLVYDDANQKYISY